MAAPKEGDVFYTSSNGEYRVYKLLRLREFGAGNSVSNVRCYNAFDRVPTEADVAGLGVFCGVTPISTDGFEDPTVITNIPVTKEESDNYLEYLMLSEQFQDYCREKARAEGITIDELVTRANVHYRNADKHIDERELDQAVDEYTKCIELFPLLWEAYDNRGLVRLDKGDFDEAEGDFNMSLRINPEGEMATEKLLWIAKNKHA